MRGRGCGGVGGGWEDWKGITYPYTCRDFLQDLCQCLGKSVYNKTCHSVTGFENIKGTTVRKVPCIDLLSIIY